MSARTKGKGPTLFAAAGLDQNAPRPLADKLRPQKVSDVVGQDHLLGPRLMDLGETEIEIRVALVA